MENSDDVVGELKFLDSQPKHEAFYHAVMNASNHYGLNDMETIALLAVILGRYAQTAQRVGAKGDFERVTQTVLKNLEYGIRDKEGFEQAFKDSVTLVGNEADNLLPGGPGPDREDFD